MVNIYQNILLLGAIYFCLGQNINSPALDWIQTDGLGAYRYGYATGDEGRHYHIQSASADNTVAGRFGYREPGTGRDLQTTYTAGKRGFRARGPHIARRMDLSQIKLPFSRPNDDGQYHPELDNFFDPNEDRGFDYSYRTSNHVKDEHANRVGDVQGRYSYLDDLGFRHDVNYIAGSKTGFVVSNPVPDTFAQARGGPLYYVGKSGGAKIRGFSAVQKTLNGAYRFLASGPDHKRSEITDAAGNRRGVYTYLDDKGIQHTVEYIAGPKIGYRVISNRRGVNYNPLSPFFIDSSTVSPLLPSSPSSVTDKPIPNFPSTTFGPFPSSSSFGSGGFPSSVGGSGDGPGGFGDTGSGGDLFPNDGSVPPLGGLFPANPKPSEGGLFPTAAPGVTPSPGSNKPSTPLFKPTTVKPPLFKPSPERPSASQDGAGKEEEGFPSPIFPSPAFPSSTFPTPVFPSSTFPSPIFPSSSPSPFYPVPFDPAFFPKWAYDYNYFLQNPANAFKDWSRPFKGSGKKTTSDDPSVTPFPDFFPSPFPDLSFKDSDPFNEGLNGAESGSAVKPSAKGKTHAECNCTVDGDRRDSDFPIEEDEKGDGIRHGETSNRIDTSSSSASSESGTGDHSPKHYFKSHKAIGYPSRGTVKFGGFKKSGEWHKIKHEDGYLGIPPGVAVRAHVQSLDIVPYDKRYISPGEALKHHEKHEKNHQHY